MEISVGLAVFLRQLSLVSLLKISTDYRAQTEHFKILYSTFKSLIMNVNKINTNQIFGNTLFKILGINLLLAVIYFCGLTSFTVAESSNTYVLKEETVSPRVSRVRVTPPCMRSNDVTVTFTLTDVTSGEPYQDNSYKISYTFEGQQEYFCVNHPLNWDSGSPLELSVTYLSPVPTNLENMVGLTEDVTVTIYEDENQCTGTEISVSTDVPLN